MVKTIRIIGLGRVGSAVAARLRERGFDLTDGDADLVLLCVPDRAIAEVAAGVPTGPWIAHTSGATPLSALDPHERRFGLHPLQSFTRARGPEQLDGAYAAVSGESDGGTRSRFVARARARARALRARRLGAGPLPRGAVVAASYLVTLHQAAADLVEAAGAPPEALVPLMRRVIENDFELTGPAVRGDWETVEAHLEAIRERLPELEPLYRALADATAELAVR